MKLVVAYWVLIFLFPTTSNAFGTVQTRCGGFRGQQQSSATKGNVPSLPRRMRKNVGVFMQENNKQASGDISHGAIAGKNILVVGGSGRVGGSVVTQLLLHQGNVTVGGRSIESFEKSRDRWGNNFPTLDSEVRGVAFVGVNKEIASTVAKVLDLHSFDLVVHTAGPFQGKVDAPNGVLEACVQCKVPYIDVCDDYCTAMAAKTKHGQNAVDAGVPCVISTGCWPGVSSLMAKQLTTKVLSQHPQLSPKDLTVDFSFFTAGSGGAGATLLVATFLILAEKALTIVNGRRKSVTPMSQYFPVDFGPIVGERSISHLNLLETASIHDVLGIGNVKSLFGTAPEFWNTLLGVMAKLPPDLLANEDLMGKLAVFSLPIVRVVDYFAGATNAMRCDVTADKVPDLVATAIYAHENLEPCVGECVVAFCSVVLSDNVQPGVRFPEEAIEGEDSIVSVLKLASVGAHTKVAKGSMLRLSAAEVWGES